jgi:hypothetical protein
LKQVVVLQEYRNESDSAIEAKYVFPLDELAVVCGFEAFINGKHVIGVVKEKETAHKEYKQAVSEGHGAYLMDQDKEQPVSTLYSGPCLTMFSTSDVFFASALIGRNYGCNYYGLMQHAKIAVRLQIASN